MPFQGKLAKPLIMMTHGGRPQAIESGYLKIDVAFIACPNADVNNPLFDLLVNEWLRYLG